MAEVISENSRASNRELHERFEKFGSRADAGGVLGRLSAAVGRIEEEFGIKSLLDYGTGKGNVVKKLRGELSGMQVDGYDPAVEEWGEHPNQKYDILTCLDVLEHVEINSIDAVLEDIKALTTKFCFLFIDLQPAVKTLNDGRNAHVLLAPSDWWTSKIAMHFQCQMSFVINHVNGHPQKLVIGACSRAKHMSMMTMFISKLRLYDISMQGGMPGPGMKTKKKST